MSRINGRFLAPNSVDASMLTSVGTNIKNAIAGESFLAGTPLGRRISDGKVVVGDSDGTDGRQNIFAVAIEASAGDGDGVRIQLIGPNVAGALTGYSFALGDDIYIGETPGTYTNDPGTFTVGNDSVFKVGIADCADNIASTTANDLILFPEVISRP